MGGSEQQPLFIISIANGSGALSLHEVLHVFSSVTLKYKQEHKAIPALVVNNANKLPESILQRLQDYTKEAAEERIATIVFVSSEGRIPRYMQGTSILSIAHQ